MLDEQAPDLHGSDGDGWQQQQGDQPRPAGTTLLPPAQGHRQHDRQDDDVGVQVGDRLE